MKTNRHIPGLRLCILVTGAVILVFAATVIAAPSSLSSVSEKKPTLQSVSRIQLPFITNEGQIGDKDVKYYTRTFGGYFFVRENGEMVYLVSSHPGKKGKKDPRNTETAGEMKASAIKETLVNSKKVSFEAKDPAAAKVNFFVGRDPNKWKTGLSTYNSVSLGEVYEGIALSMKAYGNSVEKIFTVQPGADPGLIRLRVEGSEGLTADEKGHLEVSTGLGTLAFSKPVAYQEKDGKRVEVAVSYLADGRTYGFKVGEYDKTLPLVIDPYYLAIGSYLGGSDFDSGHAVAVDASGYMYVTGRTESSQFLTIENPGRGFSGYADAYVANIKPDGTLSYFTFLGGSDMDFADGIAVDGSGNAWITGYTDSSNFPTTVADPPNLGAAYNTFVSELNSMGSLIYSTLISPGSLYDPPQNRDSQGRCIALDGENVIVGGTTQRSTPEGSIGLRSAYVLKLTLPITTVMLATYDWTIHGQFVYGVAVDAAGNVYVTGVKDDSAQSESAFVASYNREGVLIYLRHLRTILTTENRSVGLGVAVDAAGNAYVTGYTDDQDFPTLNPIHGYAGGYDSFVTKVGPDGTILFSSFLGGNSDDFAYGIAMDSAGNVYATGSTSSSDFPTTTGAYQTTYRGAVDAFVAKIDPTKTGLNSLVYSTFLGGSGGEAGSGMAVDTRGSMYVTGFSESSNFPTTAGALQASYGELGDAFLVKFALDATSPTAQLSTPGDGATGVPVDTNIVIRIRDSDSGVDQGTITLRVGGVAIIPTPTPTPDPNDSTAYILTYTPTDPFGSDVVVSVEVTAADMAGNALTDTFSFRTGPPWDPGADDDGDDIPNGVEIDLLQTDPAKKTLFIRPKMIVGLQEDRWDGFIALFPDERPGFANIPAFSNAGIEISVIGDLGNPYPPMQDFNYDPATDPNHPPCDIVEIVHMPATAYCVFGHYNFGHTFFFTASATWYWDTKGYVPNNQTTDHYQKYHYFTAYIYPLPIDTYFSEGAYTSIAENIMPMESDGCGFNQCYDTNHASPLNLNATEPIAGLPDGTVEFNQIVFDSSKEISFVGTYGQPYDRETVLRRTIAHELGHTLLAASEDDHCSDSGCILYGSVGDWEMRDFGPGDCVHKPGGAKDIRARGVVHNSIHR